MLLLKQTFLKLRDNLVGEKAFIDIQNSFLFQLVFLSTVFTSSISDQGLHLLL